MSVSLIHERGPNILRGAALVIAALGVGVWGAILLAPQNLNSPPLLESAAPAATDTQSVAQWFGGARLRLRIIAHGVIAASDGKGAALLSIDGGAPRVYLAGQDLAPGVVLESVGASSVRIYQDGGVEEVPIPAVPGREIRGFVSALPSGS